MLIEAYTLEMKKYADYFVLIFFSIFWNQPSREEQTIRENTDLTVKIYTII